MKVIFLDIDGVLCTRRARSNRPKGATHANPGEFHKPILEMFEQWLMKHSNVKIVLSSTWRLGKENGKFPELFWKTAFGKNLKSL